MNATTVSEQDRAQEVPCNICGVDDATILFGSGEAQRNQIVRCNRCGLMYANPRVSIDIEEIERWPDDPHWDMAKELPQIFEKERLQVRDYARTRKTLKDLHPSRGQLIEVGSSMGMLLKSFREDGWDVCGIEPDRNGCRYATQTLGIPTIVATLETAQLPSAFADVVVMFHVIEHLPNPIGTLHEVYRVLKPGGTFVLETPRYDTLMFSILGRRERSLSCDGHIYFFTNKTLIQICHAAGFEIRRHDAVGRSLTLDRLAYNIGVISRSRSIQNGLRILSRRLRLQKVSVYLNFRDMQRLILRKPQ